MPTTDSAETNGSAGSDHIIHELPPCACCVALAHVRIPAQPTAAARPNNFFNSKKNTEKQTKKQADNQSQTKAEKKAEKQEPVWDEELLGPKPRKLWQGVEGVAVLLFGVIVPSLLLVSSLGAMAKRATLVILNHPVESIAELSLIAAIPLINFLVWRALCHHRTAAAKTASVALGCVAGSGLMVAAMSAAAMFAPAQAIGADSRSFSVGLSWLSMLSIAASAVSLFLLVHIQSKVSSSKLRRQLVGLCSLGAASAAMIFAAAEARPSLVHYAETLAVSNNSADTSRGLQFLRDWNCERELHMECADPRAAGFAGLFAPIKQSNLHDLYFRVTGVPYTFHETNSVNLSAMPDDYLVRNIVGDPIPGLNLRRSTINADLHPRTMSGTVNWTFVFKNDTEQMQEAIVEFALPEGAVINGLTSWQYGDAIPGAIALTERTEATAAMGSGDKLANVSDLGHGRVLMHCYAVNPDREFQIRLTMAVPLKPEANDMTIASLPRIIAANFGLASEQQFTVRSPGAISSDVPGLTASRTTNGSNVLNGTLSPEWLKSSKLQVKTKRADEATTIATFDPIATTIAFNEQLKKDQDEQRKREQELVRDQQERQQVVVMLDGSRGIQTQLDAVSHAMHKKPGKPVKQKKTTVAPRYVVETIDKLTVAPPKYLAVVIDGSAVMKQHLAEISQGLKRLPAGVKTDIIIASQEKAKLSAPHPVSEVVDSLNASNFVGGQDNLKAVVDAAELAAQNDGGAVLWIHAVQPAVNQEIYITSPYSAQPTFYELTLGTSEVDTSTLFRNHPGVGPFHPIQHGAHVANDLAAFFDRWQKHSSTYEVRLALTTDKPHNTSNLSREEKRELLSLHAFERSTEMLREKHRTSAALLAARYGFVSPVSYAFIPEALDQPNVEDGSQNRGISVGSMTAIDDALDTESKIASALQGATNGTIGPQGAEATVISGVNTAGTVRINNLANLEALLNIIANLGEIMLLILGGVTILHGATKPETAFEISGRQCELTKQQRIILGSIMVAIGFALPGIINWFVASARDANLFS